MQIQEFQDDDKAFSFHLNEEDNQTEITQESPFKQIDIKIEKFTNQDN